MSPQLVDQKARDMARDASAAILSHEQVCALRWKTTMSTMNDIKRIIAYATTGLIGSMGALIFYLWQHPHV